MEKLLNAIKATQHFYLSSESPWIIGFSGGKDSSLVVKILLTAISSLPVDLRKPLKILYCDTGVEIPVLRNYIKDSLIRIQEEGAKLGIEISALAIKPKLENLYFVKVLGRGYPPPTNKFRWCTNKLRIDPIQTAIKELVGDLNAVVVLGTRYEESEERNRILNKHSTDEKYIFKQAGYANTTVFSPIVDFDTDDVWNALTELNNITSIDIETLSRIYKLISGECPIVRLPNLNPCSKGRFGCWTCTVVRQDKATKNLIENGYTNLQPLYDFRSWLLSIRDDKSYRCSVRRNGVPGLGPFRLKAREEILKRLIIAENLSGYKLIENDELLEIERLWNLDKACTKYREDFVVS